MTAERWKHIKSVFEATLDVPSPERGSFLDQRCAGDAELRREVDSLLEAHENTGGFLEDLSSYVKPLAPMDDLEATAPVGLRVGAYELVREIGRGGMGSVYLATRADSEFRKRVAIKLIRHGMESPFAIRRFRNERQILATLEHPNIARLIDGGTTEKGFPYVVMELVEGEPLLQYCEAHELPIADRLEIFRKVCSAVHYAHRRMIIHRDLKPANVLVKKDGSPKLLDFGVAKLVDPESTDPNAETTQVGIRMVTPAYASPEQMRGDPATVQSDIYSLGVILCELVAGCKPAALAASVSGALHTPLRSADIHPSRVGDLRNIILHAATHEASDRYATVEELIVDLDRYLAGLPVGTYGAAAAPAPTTEPSRPAAGSVAVLPFRLIDKETGSDAFLATGMTDAIITRLSGVERISVRPTSVILRYSDTADAVAAGYELNVEFVLEGTVQRAGTRVRVSVQLVRVRSGTPVWAGKFDAESSDLLQLEDSISGPVAEAVIPQLTGEERQRLSKSGTASARAHEAYLKGRGYWNTHTEDNLAKALLSFTQAAEEDPDYALAHTGIADYYNQLGIWGGPPPAESFAAAKASAERALSIDPSLAEAHASLAFAIWALDRDYEQASHHFQMAITLNPDYANAHLGFGMLNSSRGRSDMAIASLERARRLDPRSAIFAVSLARTFCAIHEYNRAISELETRPPDYHPAFQEALAVAYLGAGRYQDAVEAARGAVGKEERPVSKCVLGMAEAAAGNRGTAERLLEEVTEIAKDQYISGYQVALLQLALGRAEEAIATLKQAYADRDWWTVWTPVDPRWDAVRAHPRFRNLPFAGRRGVSIQRTQGVHARRFTRRTAVALAAVVVVAAGLAALAYSRLAGPPPFQTVKITKLTTNGTAVRAAISADGRYVAFTGTQEGKLAVWVREAGESALTRVAGPVDGDITSLQITGAGPSVSFISYARSDPAHGTLYRAPIGGGALEKLMTDVPGPAALSADGSRIVFYRPNPSEGLDELVVAAPDGTQQRVVTRRKYPDRLTLTSIPAWSFDGRKIATAIEGSDNHGFYTKLMVADAASGKLDILEQPRFQFVERIAWMKGTRSLFAIGQEQDSSFQQIWFVPTGSGTANHIISDLNDYNGVSASEEGTSLVSVQVQTLSNLYVLQPESGAIGQITPGSGRYFDLAWASSGEIVYASDASGAADIWAMNAQGGNQRQITSGKGRSYAPAISPDSKTIAFHSNRSGNWNIWRMDITGQNLRQLTFGTRDSNWPQFTPDGRFIIYHHSEPNAMFNVYKIPVAGGTPVRITNRLTMRPAVAGDGRIACWYAEDTAAPVWKLAVLGPNGGDPVKLFDLPPFAAPDTPLRWTPKGDGITFLGSRAGVTNIYVQYLSGGAARQLTSFTWGQVYSFGWSPDGRLVYSRGMSSSDVVLLKDTTER